MGKVRKFIGEIRFYREILNCQSNENEISMDVFAWHVNDFIQEVREEINLLLNHLMEGVLKVEMDTSASDDHKIVFYNVDNSEERYVLMDCGLMNIGDVADTDLKKVIVKKDEINKILNLYNNLVFKSFCCSMNVPLTTDLSFNYSLLDGCYYFLRNNGYSYVIIEPRSASMENEYNFIYIDKVHNIGTVKNEYVSEFFEVKASTRELFNKVEEELGISKEIATEVEDIKEIIKSC